MGMAFPDEKQSAQRTCQGACLKVDQVLTIPHKKDTTQWGLFSPWCVQAPLQIMGIAYVFAESAMLCELERKRKHRPETLKERKKKRKKKGRKETKNILPLYSYGDNKTYWCWKWKHALSKETKCGYIPSHLCVSSDSRAYLATGTLAIHLLP